MRNANQGDYISKPSKLESFTLYFEKLPSEPATRKITKRQP